MKRQLVIYSLVIFLFSHCKKPGCFSEAGPLVSVKRQATAFHRIDLYDNINVILAQDTIESITVKAPQNIEQNIIASVENGTLTLRNGTSCKWLRSPSENPTVYIGVKNLDYILYAGSGDVTSSNIIQSESISLYSATGAGNVEISLSAQQLNATIEYESADFIFHGSADLCYSYANSRATLNLSDLEIKNLNIGYASVKDITVNVSDRIDAHVYHTGSIYYKGNPAVFTTYYSSGRLYRIP
jgi:hypothetical protein